MARRRRYDESECMCERFCTPGGTWDDTGKWVANPCPAGIERTHYLGEHPGFAHNEDAHSWGLTAGERAALKSKASAAECARRYVVAMYRRLGYSPRDPLALGPLAKVPHSRCDCSALCRKAALTQPTRAQLASARFEPIEKWAKRIMRPTATFKERLCA